MVDQSKFQPRLEKEVVGMWTSGHAGSQTLEEGGQASTWIP